MDIFFTLLFLSLIYYVIKRMRKNQSALWILLGVMSFFSLGYYVLPVFFKSESGLSNIGSFELSEVIFMSLLFFFFLIQGVRFGEYKFLNKRQKKLKLPNLDYWFFKNYKKLFYVSFILWLGYYFTNDLTVYNVEDLDSYYNKQSVYKGLLASLSNVFLAVMAVSLALVIKVNSKNRILMIICYVIVAFLLLGTAQRIFAITPIFFMVAALCIHNNYRLGIKIISLGIVFLLVISPFMVFLRQLSDVSDKKELFAASSSYAVDNVFESGFNSLMARADTYFVMTHLKNDFDNPFSHFNHVQYVSAIIVSFFPRIIINEKPQVLSDNGELSGEISVMAWNTVVKKGIGSLTTFGAITAYREGGWVWVILNGFLTGIAYAWFYVFFAKGGQIGKILFVSLFVTLAIKQVPPSLFYFIIFIKPTLQIAVVLFVIDKLLYRKKKYN